MLLNEQEDKTTGVELVNGTIIEANYVVSTMPITHLINGFSQVPKKVQSAINSLYFRNTILVYLEIDSSDLFTDNWLYIHVSEVLHGRITNFKNWCTSLNKDKKTTILCLEYWCFEKDALWTNDESHIIKIAKEEIYAVNLIPKKAKILNTHLMRIPKCYPVYETG